MTPPTIISMQKLVISCLALFLTLVSAQTTTVVNNAGLTVVQVVTTDPIQGITTTRTIQTLAGTGTSTTGTSTTVTAAATSTTGTTLITPTTARTTTTPQVQQGPVGQPQPTPVPGGPTPYTYTTVVNGVTTAVADIFTPTNPVTVTRPAPTGGTILPYSVWLNSYAAHTTTGTSGAQRQMSGPGGAWMTIVAATLAGLVWAMP